MPEISAYSNILLFMCVCVREREREIEREREREREKERDFGIYPGLFLIPSIHFIYGDQNFITLSVDS